MGTNFYWYKEVKTCEACGHTPDTEEQEHIGKRSAAGHYCWDCDVTLNKHGNDAIHRSSYGDSAWYERCPKCDGMPATRTVLEGAMGLELGFAEPNAERPKGVRSTSSFSWAIEPTEAVARCMAHFTNDIIVDEYGRTYTGKAFLEMLQFNCAVRFTEMIGRSFS